LQSLQFETKDEILARYFDTEVISENHIQINFANETMTYQMEQLEGVNEKKNKSLIIP
jgi:hypothetical protein